MRGRLASPRLRNLHLRVAPGTQHVFWGFVPRTEEAGLVESQVRTPSTEQSRAGPCPGPQGGQGRAKTGPRFLLPGAASQDRPAGPSARLCWHLEGGPCWPLGVVRPRVRGSSGKGLAAFASPRWREWPPRSRQPQQLRHRSLMQTLPGPSSPQSSVLPASTCACSVPTCGRPGPRPGEAGAWYPWELCTAPRGPELQAGRGAPSLALGDTK